MVGLIENRQSEGYQLSIRVGTEISQKAVIGNPLSIFQIIMVTVKLTSMQLVSESTAATSVPLDVIFKLENVDC